MKNLYIWLRQSSKYILNVLGFNHALHWISIALRPGKVAYYRGCRFYCSPRVMYEAMLLRGEYNEDKVIEHIAKTLVGRSGLFVDVGANIGVFSLSLGCLPGIRVLAIEPEPINFRRLQKNIKLNPAAHVRPLNVAISDGDDRQLEFTIPYGDNRGLPFIGRYKEAPFFTWETSVVTKKLDTLLAAQPDGVLCGFKIDVEGHELEVLEGFMATLQRSHACAGLIEIHCHIRPVNPVEIQKLIEQAGFRVQELTREGQLLPYHANRTDGHSIWVVKD
jgi:FkbM family methyltransferase